MKQNVLAFKKTSLLLVFLLSGCFKDLVSEAPLQEPSDVIDFVDTRSGTGGFWWASGHLSPAAQVPHGFVRLGPDTATFGKITSSSGYSYNDLELLGFSHTRLSGTGAYEGGVYRVKPLTSEFEPELALKKKLFFSHASEIARPGYYSVNLKNSPIKVELSATSRGGVHKYTALRATAFSLWVDLSSHIWSGGTVESQTYIPVSTDEFHVSSRHKDAFSSRVTDGIALWAKIKLSIPATEIKEHSVSGKTLVEIRFGELAENQSVEMLVAVSNVDLAGAIANYTAELGGQTFDSVKSQAQSAWRTLLSKVQLTGSELIHKKKFYENLYRAYLMPTLYSDSDGRLRDFTNSVSTPGFDFYGDLSLWDTFRTQSGLLHLLTPGVQRKIVQSQMLAYTQTGRLPRWTLGANHADSMLGFPSVMVLSESVQKNLGGLDAVQVLNSVVGSLDPSLSSEGRECLNEYVNLGFCSLANTQSVSLTLEYSYAFRSAYGLVQKIRSDRPTLAPSMTENQLAELSSQFDSRSRGAQKIWSANWETFVPKDSDLNELGTISLTDTDYIKLSPSSEHVREGSLKQWQWYPAILGNHYFDLYKNQNSFVSNLSAFMNSAPNAIGAVYPGSGFWQGNEPNLIAPYLFSLWGRPDLAAEWVRFVMDKKYKTGVMALDGDDDAGTLSSYFVWSALGFYPLAGSDLYIVGTPLFENVRLDILDSSQVLEIRAPGVSESMKYVKSVKFNGQTLENPYFGHSTIQNGGVLEFEMSSTPTQWGLRWEGL
jgi:predicted alpha-1,2-mannosidase